MHSGEGVIAAAWIGVIIRRLQHKPRRDPWKHDAEERIRENERVGWIGEMDTYVRAGRVVGWWC